MKKNSGAEGKRSNTKQIFIFFHMLGGYSPIALLSPRTRPPLIFKVMKYTHTAYIKNICAPHTIRCNFDVFIYSINLLAKKSIHFKIFQHTKSKKHSLKKIQNDLTPASPLRLSVARSSATLGGVHVVLKASLGVFVVERHKGCPAS